MPAQLVLCVICNKKGRYARSKYTEICTMEREENIQEWFRRLHRKDLNYSLLNHQIHVTCYKSLVRDLKKISTIIKKESPTVLKNYSQSSDINPVLTDITNNQPATTYDPYFFSTTTDTNVFFNVFLIILLVIHQ